jgi:hypothetical protein
MQMTDKLHFSPTLVPSKKPGYPFNRRLVVPQRREKFIVPAVIWIPYLPANFLAAIPTTLCRLRVCLVSYWLDGRAAEPWLSRGLSLLRGIQSFSGTQPNSYWMSTGDLFLAVMRIVREANYSRPAGNESKNAGSYITNPHHQRIPPPPKKCQHYM